MSPSAAPPTHQPTSPNPQSPNAGRAPARDLKKAEARVPAWGERSKDGTLNRVRVAPTGVTAVHPQASMAFAGGPPTTRPNARSQPARAPHLPPGMRTTANAARATTAHMPTPHTTTEEPDPPLLADARLSPRPQRSLGREGRGGEEESATHSAYTSPKPTPLPTQTPPAASATRPCPLARCRQNAVEALAGPAALEKGRGGGGPDGVQLHVA
ncbi:hypothetical protein ZEAMMB73_Zm00001d028564 [Zea mays]|jgi:hypothetical protein|uniref:Uncharacterized protein n=1 Tax=Zea mays TaxID=4577 RepID=A0A1D6JXJ9_MAIZE|nr:hypothetical protein ZEAMMB73_Zm00001d028564 [Zea mays]